MKIFLPSWSIIKKRERETRSDGKWTPSPRIRQRRGQAGGDVALGEPVISWRPPDCSGGMEEGVSPRLEETPVFTSSSSVVRALPLPGLYPGSSGVPLSRQTPELTNSAPQFILTHRPSSLFSLTKPYNDNYNDFSPHSSWTHFHLVKNALPQWFIYQPAPAFNHAFPITPPNDVKLLSNSTQTSHTPKWLHGPHSISLSYSIN